MRVSTAPTGLLAAWVLGTALQLQQASLSAVSLYQGCLAAAVLFLALGLFGVSRHVSLRARVWLRMVTFLLAGVVAGFGATGWRAADFQAQAATLKNADAELARRKDLLAKGFSPKAEFEAALARRNAAAAALERMQAQIADKVIRAPWDGQAGIRKVDPGAFVAPGTPLVRLQAIDPVYVDFNVPENDFARVAAGQQVEATFGAWPGQIFKGAVEAVDAEVVENTRAFTVRAKLANPDAHMVPGMFANIAVVAGEPARVVTLPQTAVTYSLYGDSVYVVVPQPDAQAGATDTGEPKLQVERRFVRLGEARGGRVWLLEGVKEGEQVVTAGQLKLRPGAFVRIDNSVALEQTGERKAE